jgi:hypothetical protein
MKKILLFLFFIGLQTAYAQPQINTPTNYNLCDIDNNGSEVFYLTTKNSEILGNLSQNVYSVTYHLSQVDAVTNTNALSSPYLCFFSGQIVFVRVTQITDQTNFSTTTLGLYFNPAPIANTITTTFCYNQQCWDLTQLIPVITNSDPSLSVTFYTMQADAESNSNPIMNPSCFFSATTIPNINFYYLVTNTLSNCSAVGTINAQIITSCPPVDCIPPVLTVGNATQTSVNVTYVPSDPNTITEIEIAVYPMGAPIPTQGVFYASNNIVIIGLDCGIDFQIIARKICIINGMTAMSSWSNPIVFTTPSCIPQFGQPQSLVLI